MNTVLLVSIKSTVFVVEDKIRISLYRTIYVTINALNLIHTLHLSSFVHLKGSLSDHLSN